MDMSAFVIGGISTPKVVTVGDNLCLNPRFTNGSIVGWSSNYALNGNKFVSSNSYSEAFKEYMLRMYWIGIHDDYYGRYNRNIYPETIQYVAGKKILVAMRIKSNKNLNYKLKISLSDSNTSGIDKEFFINTKIKRIAVIFDFSGSVIPSPSVNPNYLSLRIYGSIANVSTVDIIFDDIYICEIFDEYNLVEPQKSFLNFEESAVGQNELLNGMFQKFNKKFRPIYNASWDFSDVDNEVVRKSIFEVLRKQLFIFPHSDFEWGFFCVVDGDFKWEYAWDKYVGYNSDVVFKGVEFFKDTIHPVKFNS